MSVSFTAIDFETANGSPASACAVGLVKVIDGETVDRAGWLIRPPAGHDDFAAFNVSLHGVSRERVANADSFAEQLPRLLAFAAGDTLVAHNAPFDLGVLAAASQASGCALPDVSYFCTLRAARRVYDLASYRLPLAAAAAGFVDLVHHDPVSDAEASAAIALDAARRTGSADLDGLGVAVGSHVRTLAAGAEDDARDLVSSATISDQPGRSRAAASARRPAPSTSSS